MCLLLCGIIRAQVDTVKLLPVIVTSFQDESATQTSIQIQPITLKQISQSGAFNISDALAKIPGVSQLSTGIAISKPVIRGLYGNRVLVLVSGLRFDNQQWQDEHGLGLSEIGIDRVELIKGPYSIFHGTEAVAGVINIIEETKPELHTAQTDYGIKINSNTLGGMMQFGYKANYGNNWIRIRIGAENNADYTDGSGARVLNSRFDGYYLKGTYGFNKKNWTSENNYHFSFNRYGFIFSDITDFFEEPDARWARNFPGPHHVVMLNLGSSQNTFYLPNSTIKLNVGVQSNLRMEDEGGGAISLNMHLLTGEYTFRWLKTINPHLDFAFANISSVEQNTNYGKKRIVPDAWLAESSGSGYLKYHITKSVFEIGGGAGLRYIKTLLTPGVNTPDKDIDPFTIYRPFVTGLAGWSYLPTQKWNLKTNISTGVRSPNLAELSSNGLHEGVFTYDVGDPTLKNEKNINSELSIDYNGDILQGYAGVFYNHFIDYIYIEPTGEEWFGFPIYRYKQQTANLSGFEVELSCTPPAIKNTTARIAFSAMQGVKEDGSNLPFIPANKLTPELKYSVPQFKSAENIYAFVNSDFVFGQYNTAAYESSTPQYVLLNAGAGFVLRTNNFPVDISLTGNNLLNTVYVDHLSRFKDLGYKNIGLNLVLNIKIILSKQIKTN